MPALRENLAPLTYAVRLGVVAKYLAQLNLVMAVLVTVPLAVSLAYGEFWHSGRLATVALILLVTGLPGARLPAPPEIQRNEAMIIVAMTFLISAGLLSFPLAEAGVPYADALFEAISGVTTTGLTTLPTLDGRSHTFLFLRAWLQWFGGLGIAVMSVALLATHRLADRQLTESAGAENFATTARVYAQRLLTVYAVMTLAGFGLLRLFVPDTLTAAAYILSSVSTGGFAPLDGSLSMLGSWEASYTVVFFSFLGAVPLILYYHAFRRDWRKVGGDMELRGLLAATLCTILLLSLVMPRQDGLTWPQTLAHNVVTAVSAQTTTGFATFDMSRYSTAAKLVLMLAMGIGGGAGSSAGGIKILRLLILLRLLQLTLRRTAMAAHAVVTPHLRGKVLEDEDIIKALLLVTLFGGVILLSWIPFLAWGYDPMDSLFEIVSAADTVGLTTGVTSMDLPSPLKAILCADMLLGRLEIVALVIVFYPRTWLGNRTPSP